jgi:hypothetical protein
MGAQNIVRLLGEGLIASDTFDLAAGEALNVVPVVDDQGSIIVGTTAKAMDVKWYGTTATSIALFDAGNNKLDLAGVALTSNAAINTTGTLTVTTSNATTANFTNVTTTNANATTMIATGAVNSATMNASTSINTGILTVTTNTNTAGMNITGTAGLTGTVVPATNGAVYQKIIVQNTNTTLNAAHWGALMLNKAASDRIYTLPDVSAGLAGVWFEYASSVAQNTTFTANTANTILALNTLAANSVALNTANQISGATCKFVCDGSQWIFMTGSGTATPVD